MATKLYLHAAQYTLVDRLGALPSAEQSALTSANDFEASQAITRYMDTNIGTAQTSIVNVSTGSTSQVVYYAARWVSKPLNQTSVAANTWDLNFAAAESDLAANFPCAGTNQVLYVNAFVWRPSTSTKIGTILDGNTAAAFDEPGAINSIRVMHGTFTGSSVASVQAGDVIVFELWFRVTQGSTMTYNQTIYFDGTTENTTENAVVTNHASFIQTPENLVFQSDPTAGAYNADTETFAKPVAGTASFDQVVYGFTNVPKAALFHHVVKSGNGLAEGYSYSTGFSDATNHRCFACISDDNVATSNSVWHVRNDACISLSSGTATVLARANVKTFHTDGRITLTWGAIDATAATISVLAVGGSDITNTSVGEFTANTTNGTQDITGPGFTCSDGGGILFTIGTGSGTANATNLGATLANLGFATSATKEGLIATDSEDARTTPDTWAYQRTDRCIGKLLSTTGALECEGEFSAWITNGFRINWTTAPSGADIFYYMVIKGGSYDIGALNISAGTGSQSVTSTSFTPSGLFLASYGKTAQTTVQSSNRLSLGSGVSSTKRTYTFAGDKDAAGVSNTITAKTNQNDKILGIFTENATATSSTKEVELDLTSLNSDGFTLNKSTNTGTLGTIEVLWIAMGAGASLTRITQSTILKYNIVARVAQSVILKYSLVGRIVSSKILKYNILARAVKSIILKYNLAARVVASKILKYSIVGRIVATKILKYHIVARAVRSSILKYHIATRVAASKILKYNLIGRISQSVALKYNIIARVVKNTILKYNIVGRVVQSVILKYNLVSRTIKNVILKYNLVGRIVQSTILKYNLVGRIVKSAILKYNIVGRVAQSIIIKYDIIVSGLTRITQTSILKYHILERATQSKILKYSLIGRIVQSTILKYSLVGRITQSKILKYSLVGRTVQSVVLKYHLVGRILQSLILKYNISQRIVNSKIIKYNIVQRIVQSSILKYHILVRTAQTTILKYNITGRITASKILKYNLVGRITQTTIIKYHIFVEGITRVTQTVILKYNLAERITNSKILRYNLIGRIVQSTILKYNLLQQITKSAILKYNLIGRITQSVILKNNLIQRTVKSFISKYHITVRITQATILRYNILSRAVQSIILKYGIFSRIIRAVIIRYNLVSEIIQKVERRKRLAGAFGNFPRKTMRPTWRL